MRASPTEQMEHDHGPHHHDSCRNCPPHPSGSCAEQRKIDHVAGPERKHPRSATDGPRRRERLCTGPDADPARGGEGCCPRSGSEEDEIAFPRSDQGRLRQTAFGFQDLAACPSRFWRGLKMPTKLLRSLHGHPVCFRRDGCLDALRGLLTGPRAERAKWVIIPRSGTGLGAVNVTPFCDVSGRCPARGKGAVSDVTGAAVRSVALTGKTARTSLRWQQLCYRRPFP